MACKLCATRRPRRYCPGVRGDICSVCCGTERENTVACPLECEYLRAAREREHPNRIEREQIPHPEIVVTQDFVREHLPVVAAATAAVLEASFAAPGVADYDVREALDGLARTYRTLESGLYYESRPSNMVAAGVFQHVQQRLGEFREADQKRSGVTNVRDADVLKTLVFLQRLELQFNNGRKRGRAFLDFLRRNVPGAAQQAPPGSLLVTP